MVPSQAWLLTVTERADEPQSAPDDQMPQRMLPSVNSSDSLGMLVTNGPTIHPRPAGIARLNDTDSHCTYVPSARPSSEQ